MPARCFWFIAPDTVPLASNLPTKSTHLKEKVPLFGVDLDWVSKLNERNVPSSALSLVVANLNTSRLEIIWMIQ